MFTVLYKENGEQEEFGRREQQHDLLGDGDHGEKVARLGLAISKKHCRLAVGRNRLKRLVRESFRHHRADLKGLDVVVLNQPAAMRAGNKALFDSLHKHWQKCHSPQTGEAG